ncbi:hypothetical protein HPB50_024478 [Hyalomma asiaticum]|uniref:Uncharacterized protein n=1 Tax=Hyalomma asiaticum TaxID=266040 RepID=A0ACB7T8T3_HYAAI|nr:hypothetical protein HPB50_024478 [Hyalomma asiaticum]
MGPVLHLEVPLQKLAPRGPNLRVVGGPATPLAALEGGRKREEEPQGREGLLAKIPSALKEFSDGCLGAVKDGFNRAHPSADAGNRLDARSSAVSSKKI